MFRCTELKVRQPCSAVFPKWYNPNPTTPTMELSKYGRRTNTCSWQRPTLTISWPNTIRYEASIEWRHIPEQLRQLFYSSFCTPPSNICPNQVGEGGHVYLPGQLVNPIPINVDSSTFIWRVSQGTSPSTMGVFSSKPHGL